MDEQCAVPQSVFLLDSFHYFGGQRVTWWHWDEGQVCRVELYVLLGRMCRVLFERVGTKMGLWSPPFLLPD